LPSCVLIVGWSVGTQVRPAGEGTPSSPTPVVGRHHLDLDAGLAVQPRNMATQTEGSIIYALGHVLREKITSRNGRVLESNYTGYEGTRMSDVSNIEIKVVSANDVPRVVDIT
jgi:isoquinoline 1-oxidoreductase beta subunit